MSNQTYLCSYCNKSFKKYHFIECKFGHKYNCHEACYKTLMRSTIADDLQLDVELIKCPVDGCGSYLYSKPLRSMENILSDAIYSKAIKHWNATYTGDRHKDEYGRTLPNNQNDFDQHCEKIYNHKNAQQRQLFTILGLKQRPDKPFSSREYI